MDSKKPVKPKPLCSVAAIICLLIGGLLARSVSQQFDQGKNLAEYSSLGVSTSFLVALLLSGLITAMIGMIRGEKPFVLPLIAFLINSFLFFAVILHIPR